MSAILLSGKAAAWPKHPPAPSNEAESAPFNANRDWEVDRALMLERSERRAWRVAVAGLILGLIGIAAVFVQGPLRRVVEIPIVVDRVTGETTIQQRLSEETIVKPKPMVEIGGRPIMWHIMNRYARFGHNEFILPLGYRGEVIKRYFHDYKIHNSDFTVDLASGDLCVHSSAACVDWKVTLCDTGEDTEKGARIKRTAKHIGNERFMVTYGDGVADIDLDALLAFHKKHGKLGTFY